MFNFAPLRSLVATVTVAVLLQWTCFTPIEARSLQATQPDSCMVQWVRLLSDDVTIEYARRTERIFKRSSTPVDEANIALSDPLELSDVLGETQAVEFRACLGQSTDRCRGGAPCQNGGRCLYNESIHLQAYRCSCADGFDGYFCTTQIDPCSSNPCHNGGRCEATRSSYICQCPPLVAGVNCEKRWLHEKKYVDLQNNLVALADGMAGLEQRAEKQRAEDLSNMKAFLMSLENKLTSKLNSSLSGLSSRLEALERRTTGLENTHGSDFHCRRGFGSFSGVFTTEGAGGYTAFCDRTTEGGGWIVIQRRVDGTIDFNRNWADFRSGFGQPEGNFWLGLEKMHQLTSQPNSSYELRVDMTYTRDGSRHNAKFSRFRVGPESDHYRLHLSGFSSPDLTDRMSYHNNAPFSTSDNDNDGNVAFDCEGTYKSGWWYNDCFDSNFNGEYGRPETGWFGIQWHMVQLSFVEMKVRRIA